MKIWPEKITKERIEKYREERKNRKSIKKEHKRSRYKKELFRKPSMRRMIVSMLPITLLVVLLFDVFFTYRNFIAYRTFVTSESSNIERELQLQMNKIESQYGITDYNQIKSQDGYSFSNIEGEAGTVMDYGLVMLEGQYNCNNIRLNQGYSGMLGVIYDEYREIKQGNGNILAPRCYMEIYNRNGELLMDSTPKLFAILDDPMGKEYPNYVRVNKMRLESAYPGIYEEIKTALVQDNSNEQEEYGAYIDGYYIKGATIIPKAIEIRKTRCFYDHSGMMHSITELEKRFELNQCDVTGYEEVDTNNKIVAIRLLLETQLSSENAHKELYDSIPKEEIQKNIEEVASHSHGCGAGILYSSNLFHYQEVSVYCEGEGKPIILKALNYSFLQDCGFILCSFYLFTAIAGAGILWLIAVLRFNRKKLSYEVENYRRVTTDTMAHDLKSPLTAISVFLDNIDSTTDYEKIKEYSGHIRESIESMDTMISNILALSQTENGANNLAKIECNMDEIIKRELKKYQNLIENKKLQISLEGNSCVLAELEWMSRLADNLLSNAVKYSKPESEIKILLSENAMQIQNEFEYDLKKSPTELVKPFIVGDSSRSNVKGNGLGLSIVRNIVEVHGYKMNIQTVNQEFIIKIEY